MAVTTMHSPTKIFEKTLKHLQSTFTDYTFRAGALFQWSPINKEIGFNDKLPHATALLLHEVGHATLGHKDYVRDVELLRKEAEAWNFARQYATNLNIQLDTEVIEDCLDTYRQWLYNRSLCSKCNHTGLQQNQNTYNCLNCRYSWRVTDALNCNV